jgi:hypothetical protein
VSESLACCCDSQTTHIPSPTSPPSESTSCVYPPLQPDRLFLDDILTIFEENPNHRAGRKDGEAPDRKPPFISTTALRLQQEDRGMLTAGKVGYGGPRALPDHHIVVLPRCSRHLRRLRCYRHGLVQQRQAMAPGDRQICHRGRQQVACGQQERYVGQEGRGLPGCKGRHMSHMDSDDVASRQRFPVTGHELTDVLQCRSSPTALEFLSSRHQPRTPATSSRLS